MSTSEAAYRDWANLPNDILYIISSMLLTRDFLAFVKVCTSWRASRGVPSKMPCLLYFPKPNENSEQSKHPIPSTNISNIDDISNSGLYGPCPQNNWDCIGSQDGWLIVVEKYNVSLFNPLTAQKINLPPIDFHNSHIKKAVIIWPCNTDDVPIVVLKIISRVKAITFARTSGHRWYSRSKRYHSYTDVCNVEGKVYAMDSDGVVYAIKVNNSSYLATEINASYSGLGSVVDHYLLTNEDNSDLIKARGFYCFMVKLGRSIICIKTYYNRANFVKFAIKKLDMEKQMWVSSKDLGGCSLFVGDLCSISVSAEENNNIGRKCNSIYFQYWSSWRDSYNTIGIFEWKMEVTRLTSAPILSS